MFFSAVPLGPVANFGGNQLTPPATHSLSAPTTIGGFRRSGGHAAPNLAKQLFPVAWLPRERSTTLSPFQPKDQGGAKLPYTSSRLIPVASDREYPFHAIGRLFFSTPQGQASCSAAVIAPRIVLTAGHCVHSGSNGSAGFYSDFIFVPAYRQGNAPFGDWVATAWITTTTWATSKGKFPNAADYALLEIADEQGHRIAEVVDGLSASLKATAPNHVHIVGYPAAFDGGEIVHVVASSSSKKAPATTYVYGSDMTQGSSGGPWIMNLGDPADGQPSGPRNVIVGVTSYLSAGSIEGSSILDTRLLQIYDAICSHQAGNCS